MKKIVFAFGIVLVLHGATGCFEPGAPAEETPAEESSSLNLFTDFKPADFASEMKKEGAVILDVRTPEEVGEGYISGAVFVDWNSPNFKAEVQKMGSKTPVYVYCAVGGRSAGAKELMQELGFKEVHNLLGGIESWKSSGFEVAR